MIYCSKCNESQILKHTQQVFGKPYHTFMCGHTIHGELTNITSKNYQLEAAQTIDVTIDPRDLQENWMRAYKYQKEGVKWAEEHGIKCLIADEPGLGKTVQALLLLDRNYDKLTPCLIIVPASLTLQWYRFCFNWLTSRNLTPKPIIHVGEGFEIMPDEKIVIISNALIAHKTTLKSIKEYGFNCIIADESHHFKSVNAQRTKAFAEICFYANHLILLSGTPLVNNVMEYFTTLNVLAPHHWFDRYYLANLCEVGHKGKLLGLRQSSRAWFFDRIGKYVIRRRKQDHIQDLPAFRRDKTFLNSEDKNYVKTYNLYADMIEDAVLHNDYGQVIGILAKIRHITGLVKVKAVAEKAMEMIEGTDGKICIGVHHKTVATSLIEILTEYAKEVGDDSLIPLSMDSSLDVHAKQRVEDEFRGNRRIMVASILATAEGRNMQFCNQVIIAEREWNPAKEEQFEQRFWRNGQTLPVTCEYFMVKNTLDEWLDEIVDMKREVVNSGADESINVDYDLMKLLAGKITSTRLRVAGV
jgi:SWI/SNF-related matrix-associated actin-dependent regulator 1 of chromatin subfamily A